jgi:PTH1 family peptidyl-tRNA hydrolase
VPNICIIGLGNPEQKFNGARHNIGKDWIIKVIKENNLDLLSKEKIYTTLALSSDQKILWAYPNLYVNESGKCINKIIKNSNLKIENLLVIHDDLDLQIGTLRIKINGGHGGHNGLKSIINLAGNNFLRLRVGIGHPGNKTDVTNWVLGKFKPQESKILESSYLQFLNIINLLGNNEIERAQLKLHTD